MDEYAETLAATPLTTVDAALVEQAAALAGSLSPARRGAHAIAGLGTVQRRVRARLDRRADQRPGGLVAAPGRLPGHRPPDRWACCARSGIPARYVSGYLFPLVGGAVGDTVAGQSHAWVEWWCGDWVPFDPTNGVPIGVRHVIVAQRPRLRRRHPAARASTTARRAPASASRWRSPAWPDANGPRQLPSTLWGVGPGTPTTPKLCAWAGIVAVVWDPGWDDVPPPPGRWPAGGVSATRVAGGVPPGARRGTEPAMASRLAAGARRPEGPRRGRWYAPVDLGAASCILLPRRGRRSWSVTLVACCVGIAGLARLRSVDPRGLLSPPRDASRDVKTFVARRPPSLRRTACVDSCEAGGTWAGGDPSGAKLP